HFSRPAYHPIALYSPPLPHLTNHHATIPFHDTPQKHPRPSLPTSRLPSSTHRGSQTDPSPTPSKKNFLIYRIYPPTYPNCLFAWHTVVSHALVHARKLRAKKKLCP